MIMNHVEGDGMIANSSKNEQCSAKQESSEVAINTQIKFIRIQNQEGIIYKFEVIPIVPDGNCLFRAISKAIYNRESHHLNIRENIINYITDTPNWKKFMPFIQAQHDHLMCTNSDETLSPDGGSSSSTTTPGDPVAENKIDGKKLSDTDANNNADQIKTSQSVESLKSELSISIDSRTISQSWKQEYLNYMRSTCTFGTLQELVAAGEQFKFDFILLREIDLDVFNVQNFSDRNWGQMNFFYFTGDSDSGHFELLRPTYNDNQIYDIPNGNYKQIDWNPSMGVATLRLIPRIDRYNDRMENLVETETESETETETEAEEEEEKENEVKMLKAPKGFTKNASVNQKVKGSEAQLDFKAKSEVESESSVVSSTNSMQFQTLKKTNPMQDSRSLYAKYLIIPKYKNLHNYKVSKPKDSKNEEDYEYLSEEESISNRALRQPKLLGKLQMKFAEDKKYETEDSDYESHTSKTKIIPDINGNFNNRKFRVPYQGWRHRDREKEKDLDSDSRSVDSAYFQDPNVPFKDVYHQRRHRPYIKKSDEIEMQENRRRLEMKTTLDQYNQLLMEPEQKELSRLKNATIAAREIFFCMFCPCLYGKHYRN